MDEILESMHNGQFSQAVRQLKQGRTQSQILVTLVSMLRASQSSADTHQIERLMLVLAQEYQQ